MKINVGNAAKLFFSGASLESVYFEAVANAIDANATNIEIKITIDSYQKSETLMIQISDDGEGFQDKNFEKFSTLLENEQKDDHKGIGRLVFLNYFKEVSVSSIYPEVTLKKRTFIFNEKFDEECKITDAESNDKRKTVLTFTGYLLEKIKSYDYLKPESIKKSLLLHFFPLLYSLKIEKKELRIKITIDTKEPNIDYGFFPDTKELVAGEIPDLEKDILRDDRLDLFENLELLYSIKENLVEQTVITGICVDGRAISVDILSKEEVPTGYEIIFLLYSKLFTGKVNPTRQVLTLTEVELKTVKRIFSDKISMLLKEKIPKIQERNKIVNESLVQKFPHLLGYFEENPVGLIDRNKSLEIAQIRFFTAQKEILDAESLTDDQYMKSLEMSSRILTEYIMYRNLTINKLKKIDPNNKESDIHNIILPMKKIFPKSSFINDIYSNNIWLLDDKYMTYSTILSDKEVGELITTITQEDSKDATLRPDIAIVFSDDISKNKKVDVVIIELKKTGLDLLNKNTIYGQLIQRATKLLQYYPNKIQRIWFYGIIDIDNEFKLFLTNQGFIELYSNDTIMYRHQDITLPDGTKIPTGFFIQSFKAFVDDAESRNSTFLNILKESLKREVSES